jgi:hypothetical protein
VPDGKFGCPSTGVVASIKITSSNHIKFTCFNENVNLFAKMPRISPKSCCLLTWADDSYREDLFGKNPPFYFDDYTNTDNFCIWLEKVLCPELRPGQVVIMDNASFRKSYHIREIIENVGC